MDRARSLVVRCLVFGAAAVVSVGVMALGGSRTVATTSSERLPAAFPPFEVGKVKTVSISRTGTEDGKPKTDAVKLERRSATAWVVASAFDYPADTAKVEGFLKGLGSAKSKGVATSNPAKRRPCSRTSRMGGSSSTASSRCPRRSRRSSTTPIGMCGIRKPGCARIRASSGSM